MSEHISDTQLLEFRRGQAAPAEILSVDDHLAECEDCRTRLTAILPAGGSLQAWAAGAIRDEREEASNVTVMPARRSFFPIALAAAAAVILAAIVFWRPAPKAEIAKAPEATTRVKDAAGAIEIDEQGKFTTTAGLSPSQQTLLADVVRNGKFAQAAVPAELTSRQGTLLGVETPKTAFAPIGPIGMIAEDRPQFEWKPLPGAPAYRVSVFDKDFREVALSQAVSGTTWISNKPLPRGVLLIWQVAAKVNGATVTAPAPPAPEARFQLIAESDADSIIAARVQQPPSHLLLAALYAKSGMKPDALREIEILEALNPSSPVVKKLHASLQ